MLSWGRAEPHYDKALYCNSGNKEGIHSCAHELLTGNHSWSFGRKTSNKLPSRSRGSLYKSWTVVMKDTCANATLDFHYGGNCLHNATDKGSLTGSCTHYWWDLHWGLSCVSKHSNPVPSIRGKALSFLENISEYSRVPLWLWLRTGQGSPCASGKTVVPANCQGFQSKTSFCRLFCLANHSTNKQGNENDGYKQTGKNPVAVQL